MTNLQSILDANDFKVRALLRKHKIVGNPSEETIQRAYSAKGEQFMMELLKIIVPTSNYTEMLLPDSEVALPGNAATNQVSKGWGFWDNILTYITKTGETIGSVKENLAGSGAASTPQVNTPQEARKTKMLYFIAAGFVALIILILIFKKNG